MAKTFLWISPSLIFYIVDIFSVFADTDLKMVGEFLIVLFGIIINVNEFHFDLIRFINACTEKSLVNTKNYNVLVDGGEDEVACANCHSQYDSLVYRYG